MNQDEVIEFIEGLDVINVEVLKEFGFDNPSDILSMDIKPSKILLDYTEGFTSFVCDSIDFNPKYQKISFFNDDQPFIELRTDDINSVRIKKN